MLYSREDLEKRARQYCAGNGVRLQQLLGFGAQAIVFSTDRESAIKAHWHEAAFRRERNVYRRLKELGVSTVRGLNVPVLLQSHDRPWVLQMGRVSAPFLLDFGAAYLDDAPEFPTDPHTQWEQEQEHREVFGSNWPEVQRVLRALQAYGIYMMDVHPGNIRFRGESS